VNGESLNPASCRQRYFTHRVHGWGRKYGRSHGPSVAPSGRTGVGAAGLPGLICDRPFRKNQRLSLPAVPAFS
jgi:hypothetical protein